MNLRFVEAFYWVASLKSISRAADKLYLTQSAMSSRIATLEDELGVLLLDRRDKQFKLTVAGTRFLVYAQKLLELQREVKHEMGSGAPMAVSMRIGAIESVLHSWLIPWLEKLRIDHPGLELELTVETTPILMDQIQRGTLDLVFAVLPASADGVRSQALPPMEMAFVGNPHCTRSKLPARRARGDGVADLPEGLAAARHAAGPLQAGTAWSPKGARDLVDLRHGPAGAGRLRRGHAAARGGAAADGLRQPQGADLRHEAQGPAHPCQLPHGPDFRRRWKPWSGRLWSSRGEGGGGTKTARKPAAKALKTTKKGASG